MTCFLEFVNFVVYVYIFFTTDKIFFNFIWPITFLESMLTALKGSVIFLFIMTNYVNKTRNVKETNVFNALLTVK